MSGVGAIHVVLPGLGGRWQSGGLMIARRAAELLDAHTPTQVVLSHDAEPGFPSLAEAIVAAGPGDLFIVTWGPHVTGLVDQLQGHRVAYYAQSAGWGIDLPQNVPVLALSRALVAHWMERAPYQPVNLLPPVLDPRCADRQGERDIDVLFVARKSTPYLRDRLVPALADRCRLHVQEEFIDRGDLIELYRRSRVYLYSSAPAQFSSAPGAGTWVEGFGLQPLEAMACGATVFSNLHGGLSDYLEPDVNSFKIETASLDFDLRRILAAVERFPMVDPRPADLTTFYGEGAFHDRIERILPELADFFAEVEQPGQAPGPPFDAPPTTPTAPTGGRAGALLRGALRRTLARVSAPRDRDAAR